MSHRRINYDEAVELLLSGTTMADAARNLGVSKQRILQIAERSGLVNCTLCKLKVKSPSEFCQRCKSMLPALCDTSKHDAEVVRLLGVPEGRIRAMRNRLRIARTKLPRRWSSSDHERFLRMHKNGISSDEIASKLDRTASAIEWRASAYRQAKKMADLATNEQQETAPEQRK